MTRTRLYTLALLTGVVGIAGCTDQVARDTAKQALEQAKQTQAQVDKIDKYLTLEFEWQRKLYKDICQLEARHSTGLDPDLRLCDDSPTDKVPPPTYPQP